MQSQKEKLSRNDLAQHHFCHRLQKWCWAGYYIGNITGRMIAKAISSTKPIRFTCCGVTFFIRERCWFVFIVAPGLLIGNFVKKVHLGIEPFLASSKKPEASS
jgi:hypothetical protein